jgi:hypothetical protein
LIRQLNGLSRLSQRYSWLRLAIFVVGAAISFMAFRWLSNGAGWVSIIISSAVFVTVVYFHRRLNAGIQQWTLWRQIKLAQVARLQLDWDHIPRFDSFQARPDHPFEADLDLVGEHSLHHLINVAVSGGGSKLLREWLANADPHLETIQRRQALVRELARLPRFRDKLLLKSSLTRGAIGRQWNGSKLVGWLEQEASAPSLRTTLITLCILSALNIVLFALYSQGTIPPWWGISLVIYAGLSASKILRTGGLFDEALELGASLGSLREVFAYLEGYPYGNNPHLKALCEPFLDAEDRASAHLRRITRVISAASLQRTQLLWLAINVIIPWDIYFAYRLNQLKVELGKVLPRWLNVWFELEALNSLANLAYLNPEYTFPELMSENVEPALETIAVGHPLLHPDTRITNDFAIRKLGDVVIITGSNMSGKSSFLRTMGVNLCLANAGGPVNAEVFKTRLLRLFTCIKVSDSVTDGISYFYAEVKRLKALLNALETDDERPLFFLIDEIFRGTNNRERLIGSRAYVRALTRQHGIGIVSTHDLELVKLASSIEPIHNFHFEETVADGRMVFDYRLRPGPSPTTNALKIMQMEGLPIDPDTSAD